MSVSFRKSMSIFKNCALLLIDFQQQWTKGHEVADQFPNLKQNVRKLVEFARNNNLLVIHIHADYHKEHSLWFDEEKYSLISYKNNKPDFDLIKPTKDERIFYKSTFDAFYKTTLNEYLQSNNIKTVYGAGLVTSVCVLNTLHGSYINGYKTFIVEDCCGDTKKAWHDTIIEIYSFMMPVVCIKNQLKLSKL
eukprot:UN11861